MFCTFNPTYLGRATLPDSLTALLRPVAMLLPDKKHIAEAALAAAGFQAAKQLASKTVAFFQTAQEMASQSVNKCTSNRQFKAFERMCPTWNGACFLQLSLQVHYDFGLRSIKATLLRAGELLAEAREGKEEAIIVQSIWYAGVHGSIG